MGMIQFNAACHDRTCHAAQRHSLGLGSSTTLFSVVTSTDCKAAMDEILAETRALFTLLQQHSY